MAEKRKRGQNFSNDEKDRLIKLVAEHKATILNKKTDGTTNEAKAKAWLELTDSFNTEGSIYRSKDSLLKMWDKLKSDSKIYFTASRREATQTGGEPPVVKIDPLLEQVCSLMGRGCTGILGVPDSDAGPETAGTLDHPKVILLEIETAIPSHCNEEKMEPVARVDEVADDNFIRKTPLWSRRRPVLSQVNERTEAMSSLCNSFKDINKKKEDSEDLKRALLMEEIEFKRKLYELQLQSAEKEVEIKTEILRQIKGGDMQIGNLFGLRPKKTE